MSKNGNYSISSKSQNFQKTKNTSNIQVSSRQETELKDYEIDSDFFEDFNPNQQSNIFQKSADYSYNEQRKSSTQKKVMRRKDEHTPEKSLFDRSQKKGEGREKEIEKDKGSRISKYSNFQNELEKQRALYSSPDFQSGSPFQSPLFLDNRDNKKDLNDIAEMGYKTNFAYESKKINGKNYGTFSTNEKYEYINRKGKKEYRYEKSNLGTPDTNEIISPVGYVENSSGSENEENHMKSFDNYQSSIKANKNRYNRTKIIKKGKDKLNYELEDPEGFDYLGKNQRKVSNEELKNTSRFINRSQIRNQINDSIRSDLKDFQSPDRNVDENKKFRKVNMRMIDSKGPSNDDRKVTKMMTKQVVKTANMINYRDEEYYVSMTKFGGKSSKYSEDKNVRTNAAKIIQAWWRRNFRKEEEVYDITVKSAVKIQSFMRGFLVRKKVLRYITLAIYYQSFCDKLQDVLCNNVKKEIFKLFKEKFLYKRKSLEKKYVKYQRVSKETISKRRKILINIIKKYYKKYIFKSFIRWKEKAYRLKIKDRNIQSYKYKQSQIALKDNNLNKIQTQTQRKHTKEVKVTTVKKATQQITTSKQYQTRTYNIAKTSINKNKERSYNVPRSPRPTTTTLYYKGRTNPYTYSNDINEDLNRTDYFPDNYSYSKVYNYNNYENSYYFESNNLNKSYDNVFYKNEKDKDKLKYSTIDERSHHTTFSRVDLSNERKKNISPEFGTLRKIKDTKDIKEKKEIKTKELNKATIKVVDRRTLTTKTNLNLDKKIKRTYNINTDITNRRRAKNIIKTTIKKEEGKTIKNFNTSTYNRRTKKSQDISKTAISKVMPKRQIFLSESENLYTQKKTVKRTISDDRFKSSLELVPSNMIDNQLSLSIVKLPEDNLNKTMVKDEVPETIKIKEKIIIQKEMEKETAEEGNNFQIFDMTISRRVSLFIEASHELGKKITEEQKELEIVRKREREKNLEIDKYKKDIEIQKSKSLIDTLRHAIRVAEGFKKRILYKKFNQYRKKCYIKSFILEIDPLPDFEINKVIKEKKDFGVQMSAPPEKKVIRSFKMLKISEIPSVSYLRKKKVVPQKITNSKLNIISKIKKKDQGQQSDSWNTQVTNVKNNDINLVSKKPKKKESNIQSFKGKTIIGQTKEIEILRTKPKMIDDEVQHEYEDNEIEAESLEILGAQKAFKDSTSQYENYKPKIIKGDKLSIINKTKKIKKETRDAQCNAVIYTVDQGINTVEKIKPKPKNIEVQIRTVKRSLAKMEIPILKKIWLRKAFKTFRENCNRPPFHLILERELLRMAFLRWRFKRGYGPDRYGNAYDRDGNFLYKIKGKVADSQIQNEYFVEQDDQGTQYVPIENIITTLKQIEFAPSYKKQEKKKTKDVSVGNNIEMEEVIENMDSFDIKQKKKKKVPNKITNNNFNIMKKMKKLKDSETQMTEKPKAENEIVNLYDIKITNDQYVLYKKNRDRLRDLLIQLVYRKIITDKLDLSDALRNWLKNAIMLSHIEENELENLRRRQTKIKKNERFSLIEKISKEDSSTQVKLPKNKIENTLNLNLVNKIKKKNAEINVNLPSQFDLDKIEPQRGNKMLFKSSKKPVVLKTHKENDMNIYSADYIFKEEVRRGIHHPMTENAKKRVTEILYKFFDSRGGPMSLLRKYFIIWFRKVNYLNCLDNARIISKFCKRHLYNLLNNRKWRKITEKLILKERLKIIKSSKEVTERINKIFDLIRITRVNSVFSKKRYLHFLLIAWLAYTRTINQKRSHVKSLYENMITTYMNLADDVFGNNQKENPSVQDALFEAVESNKFQTQELEDVPLAQEYYEKRREITKISKNITSFSRKSKETDNDSKEYSIYKSIVSSHPISSSNNSYFNRNDDSSREKIKVRDEERLHSKGRGRAYRTEFEKNIINNYSKNRIINSSRKDDENESDEEKEDDKGNNTIETGKFAGRRILKSYNFRKYNDLDENNDNYEEGYNNNENNQNKSKNRNFYESRRKLFKRKDEES